MFEIESGIPVPARARRGSTYPFAAMKVNDSFFVGTADEAEDAKAVARIAAAARIFRRGNPSFAASQYISRPVTEGDKVGVRTWRTK